MRRPALAAVLLILALLPCPSWAWTLFFESVPVAGYTLPGLVGAPYVERLALTRASADGVVPQVTASLGLAGKTSTIAVGPCGWKLGTQPAMRLEIASDRTAALNLAAALGYVFRQSAVLAADFDDPAADAVYGVVKLPPGPVDPVLTHRFYMHAAAIDRILDGGYSTVPEGLLFLDLGRSDPDRFLASLRRAAETFGEADVKFVRSGKAKAVLVLNNWDTDPEGGAFRHRFPPSLVTLLDQAAARNQAIIDRLAERFRWRPPPLAREAEPQATTTGP
ncbi:hypothetical protein [Stella sp.]|uniref:hypothetical protein n=1 Tax=Stella sp. TaxID=2912054 RepID=UPI0035B3F2EB